MKPYYQDASCTIYHGDCLEVMALLPDNSVEIAVTSPPYNLGEGMEDKGGLRVGHGGSLWKGGKLRGGYGTHEDAMPYDAYCGWQEEVLSELWRITQAIYYNHKPRVVKRRLRHPLSLVPLHIEVRQVIVWDRGSGFNFMAGAYVPQHELILLMAHDEWSLRDKAASGVGDVWRLPPSPDAEHPAPFPIQLPMQALETSGAASVIDPFCGIGTTLRAAKDLGRNAVGIEIEERYCEIAANRLAQEVLAL